AHELSSSDDSAQRFGEKAVEAYRSFGLPEPHWTGPDVLKLASRTRYWKWVALGLSLTLIGGASTWMFRHFLNHSMKVAAITSLMPEVKPAEIVSKLLKDKKKTISASKRSPVVAPI